MNINRSRELLARAERVIPGGVNSPVRAFGSVGGTPRFVREGSGPYLVDADGNRYIDYVCSWGPLIFGHAREEILAVVSEAMHRGTSFGAPTEAEVELAELIVELIPSVDMVRLVSSGTEATMSAIRLARAATKRDCIIKFDGCYHGHSDSLLVAAGSGVATFGIPGSPGVPEAIAEKTLSVPFNNLDALDASIEKAGAKSIAAIIVEPIPGNMGFVLPQEGYLQALRERCDAHGIVLIFDEVMSGFRVALGGAQAYFDVRPDLTTFGKVIGGGLPAAAFGGKRELMSMMAPVGPVYQAGTLSGNPLAVAAGSYVLKRLRDTNPFSGLEERSLRLVQGLADLGRRHDVPMQTDAIGGMFGFFFTDSPVQNFEDVHKSDRKFFSRFFQGMLTHGVYLPPSAYEACFISTEHNDEIVEQTLHAADRALADARTA